MSTDFLNKDYEAPVSTGNYMKFKKNGGVKFRVLSNAVTGFEYWNTESRPVRSPKAWFEMPKDIKLDKDDKPTKIKHFWAFVVWNYEASKVQVLEVTQVSVRDAIMSHYKEEAWGDPKGYDITVNSTGVDLDTKYTVVMSPPTPISDEIKAEYEKLNINLDNLFTGEDPFINAPKVEEKKEEVDQTDIDPTSIPF